MGKGLRTLSPLADRMTWRTVEQAITAQVSNILCELLGDFSPATTERTYPMFRSYDVLGFWIECLVESPCRTPEQLLESGR